MATGFLIAVGRVIILCFGHLIVSVHTPTHLMLGYRFGAIVFEHQILLAIVLVLGHLIEYDPMPRLVIVVVAIRVVVTKSGLLVARLAPWRLLFDMMHLLPDSFSEVRCLDLDCPL